MKCNKSKLYNNEFYKCNLSNCRERHELNNILIDEFENTQNIDISSIKCKLYDVNMSNLYNNELFICLNCNINLCPLCKSKHKKDIKL